MKIRTEAEVLRIYVGESDHVGGKLVYETIVEEAHRRGLAGATVVRGLLGFGAGSLVHTAKILRLSEDLPVVVEIVDRSERIAAFLPLLEEMVGEGAITRHTVAATFHCSMRVRDVMTGDVVSVSPDTPLPQVLDLLLARGIKAVAVTEGRKIVGMITGGDLLMRAGMAFRLSLYVELPAEMRGEEARKLSVQGKTAQDVMSGQLVTVNIRATVPEAAALMAARKLKRLPVVDDAGDLVGIVSRIDILRTISTAASMSPPEMDKGAAREAEPRPTQLPQGLKLTAGDVMLRDIPTVGPDAPLEEALGKLVASPLRRVVVVDEADRVLGIVLDRELLKRYSQREKPGLLKILTNLLTPGRDVNQVFGVLVREAMEPDVFSVREDTPLSDVLRSMLETGGKRLVVLDAEGRLKGMVDRDRMLGIIGGA
ncbi:MAG: signal transduction protein [Deltaproteobacteria bacterium HGW-Deltaproteobacteria-8]|jgi:CBS domain-containing protein|nr:MAG: signal transduction protein [Deltaproteobacteria bacterium HGW-Deltaproteobacteria-8]